MRDHRATFKLGLPIAIGQLGTIVLTFADTMMVGRYGTAELAAASFVNSIFNLATMIVMGYSYGITPLVARHYGRGEKAEAGAVLRRGLWLNLMFGASLLFFFGVLYFLLDRLRQPADLLPLMRPYYLTVWASMWFVVVFGVVRQFTDAITHTRLAMWLLLLGNVVNILLNALLIFGIPPFPEMGLLGAGVATLVSRALIAAIFVAVVFGSKCYADYRRSPPRSPVSLWELHCSSWPVGAQLGWETFAFTCAAIMAGWMGKIPLAAYQVLIALGTLGFTIYYSFGSGLSIRAAHFLGQNNLALARRSVSAGRDILLAVATLVSAVFLLFGRWIISLFTTDPSVAALAVGLLPALVLYQYADAMQICYANALRATGRVSPMMWIGLIAYLLVGIPVAYVQAFPLGGQLTGLYLSFTCCLLIAAVLFHRHYRRALQ